MSTISGTHPGSLVPLTLPTGVQMEEQTEECSAGLSNGERFAGQEHRANMKALLLSDTLKSHPHPLRQ